MSCRHAQKERERPQLSARPCEVGWMTLVDAQVEKKKIERPKAPRSNRVVSESLSSLR